MRSRVHCLRKVIITICITASLMLHLQYRRAPQFTHRRQREGDIHAFANFEIRGDQGNRGTAKSWSLYTGGEHEIFINSSAYMQYIYRDIGEELESFLS